MYPPKVLEAVIWRDVKSPKADRRVAAKISQEELAARIGVDQAYVSRLEADEMNATITTLEQVALALSTDLKNLVDTKK